MYIIKWSLPHAVFIVNHSNYHAGVPICTVTERSRDYQLITTLSVIKKQKLITTPS